MDLRNEAFMCMFMIFHLKSRFDPLYNAFGFYLEVMMFNLSCFQVFGP